MQEGQQEVVFVTLQVCADCIQCLLQDRKRLLNIYCCRSSCVFWAKHFLLQQHWRKNKKQNLLNLQNLQSGLCRVQDLVCFRSLCFWADDISVPLQVKLIRINVSDLWPLQRSVKAAGGLVDLIISSREQNLVQFRVFRSEALCTETSVQQQIINTRESFLFSSCDHWPTTRALTHIHRSGGFL